jgi:ADP-ribose pyrophosphatase
MKIKNRTTVYDGFIKVDVLDMVNDKGEEFKREVMRRPDAVAAVVINTTKKTAVLVSQYRPGPDFELLELVAGTIEDGMSPDATMIKEIYEETGYRTDTINLINSVYVSPGANTEMVHLYVCTVSEKMGEGGGLDEEHEDINVVELPIHEFANSHFSDAKTMIGALWAKLNY